ncbi:MAG: PEP-CTERM sorting domain-containing protein [Pseudomonadales bacterium]|nr:PEP-CTERM sorting domain-containing protein [Pseudomonadales bacterium]
MATFNKLAIATVLAAASATATADTLLISYSGDADVYIPDAYADLYSVLEGDPALATFNGEIIVPDFQDYQEGSFVLNSLEGDFQMSLFTPIFRGLEGSQSRITVDNPDYDTGLPDCSSTRGCLADGTPAGRRTDPELIVLDWNWPTMTISERGVYTFDPADAQYGDVAELTIVDGQVTSFIWGTYGEDSTALAGFNNRTFADFPVAVGSIEVTFEGTTPYLEFDGTTYFAQNDLASAAVSMVPEASTYAMMLAGLGMIGSIVRRREKRQARA